MHDHLKRLTLISLVITLALSLLTTPAMAVWQVLLDEDFNKDQQIQNLRWPWITDFRANPPLRWHWNPMPPHFRAEGDTVSNYCWGLQDHIYSRQITPDADIQQAMWCAITNLGNVNNPRWPENDQYMNNQTAWMWWGPVDLSDAVGAGVSFWMYLDLDNYARDSLSVIASNRDPADLTDEDFFNTVPIGRSYARRISNDWVQQIIYLDSLVLAGDEDNLVSMLGENQVWIAFVWHSDNVEITGTGAFIDDVTFSWDDGLFDIFPLESYLGYQINADSTDWSTATPDEDDEIMFQVTFMAQGTGETPEFTAELYFDDELIYSEVLAVEGSGANIYTVTADTLWTATPDSHFVRWELDVPVANGGNVEESHEDNNVIESSFFVIHNPPPVFSLSRPDVNTPDIVLFDDIIIEWSISDTLEDNDFSVILYWTTDTTGLTSDISLLDDYGFVNRLTHLEQGDHTYNWEANGARGYRNVLEPGMKIWIVGLAADGFPGNQTLSISPGTLQYPLDAPDPELSNPETVERFGLNEAYPNPFNKTITIDYSLPEAVEVNLSVFDMAGRLISTLTNGMSPAGNHTIAWMPQEITAGVYLVRLSSASKNDIQKVVYLP